MADDITALAEGGLGAPVRRVEDGRLLRGRGRYTDDHRLADAAHMVLVRSPHAAARIRGIDASAALAMPGVLGVLTGGDLEQLGALQTSVARNLPDGSPMPRPPYRILATDAARFVGDPVAAVVAETRAIARDAAEVVAVEWETLPAVTDASAALEPGAPAVWPEQAPDNLCFLFSLGNREAVEAGFAKAAHVARLPFRVSRISANPLEPRGAIGAWDEGEGRWTLISGVQIPHKIRSELAGKTLRVADNRLRLISPDMGGAFGMRGSPTQEHALVLWAARLLGRPVRWIADRTESFLSDFHARDNDSVVELALDAGGTFLALRIRTVANLGAYLAFNTPHSPTNNLGGLAGVYRTPAILAEVRGAFTNTQPTAPYRGAGRPEATYAIERVIDLAAAEMGIDRVALRERNLIPREAMPFKTGLVFTYDSGDFARGMAMALEAADWAGFPARREEAKARGMLRGIGIANAIEIAAGPFRAPNEEGAGIRFEPDGGATLLLGSHNHGQGHETAFRQLASTLLGLSFDRVRVVFGDTDLVPHGRGTFGSRSLVVAGTAMAKASERIIARGKRIAAHLLEAAEADIAFESGSFRVAGTDRAVRIEDVAVAAYTPNRLPKGEELGLAADAVLIPDEATFPNGCHVAEVEIDPETGVVRLVSYVVSDDVGTVINPLLLKGQIHGGVAQGVGQVLGEAILYDEAGQLVTASFMDYRMPRAADLPSMVVESNPQPTSANPLGAKGAGEAGTVGALPVVINAIVDALSPLGIRHVDMPATPERVWRAIREARASG
ncbi:xanthine dehydrogenase family protein molybdopterin-binding subunit [Elioraea rosea]|uniref:xanthine dehydrogenase family protein molybdopterin-binding subunit n=1 Tax=Elioraea rosea TaxID=2492390 RepID=UPI0011821F3B|nr:xanthine dehydrogenase family protein molybdopterin-binding subunit [Elioraea rosea]